MPVKKTMSSEAKNKENDQREKSKSASNSSPSQKSKGCCSEEMISSEKSQSTLPLTSGCCMGKSSSYEMSSDHTSLHHHASMMPGNGKLEAKKGGKTKIVVRYDVGFHNSLSIRGKGGNLTWERGIPLKNIKHDEWIWESDAPFSNGEFKVLINDHHFESGPNHILHCGASIQYTPKF